MAHGDSEHGEFDPADPGPMSEPQHGFELGTDGPAVILVGVDDSVTAARAAAYASGLARRQHARVIAVYVQPGTYVVAPNPAAVGVVAAELEAHEAIAAELRDRSDAAAKELGISVTFMTARGDAYSEIRRIADEVRADAIVVGASAKAGHRFVGSLAVRLVRAGKWPVTVVP